MADLDSDLTNVWKRLGSARWIMVALFVLSLVPNLLRIYVDGLWFESLSYGSVFATNWKFRIGVFVFFSVATFFILKLAFDALERAFRPLKLGGTIQLENRPIHISPDAFIRPVAWAVSLLWAFLLASTMASRWPLFALFFNRSPLSGKTDPIFHKAIEWYLFQWPIWQLLASWLTGLAALILIAASVWAGIGYISRLSRTSQQQVRVLSFRVTAMGLAAFFVAIAWQTYLSRFSFLWHAQDSFTGIGYVAAHIRLPARLVMMGVLILCAALAVWNGFKALKLRTFIIALLTPLFVFIAAGLVASYVSNLVVKPNQLALESKYMEHNLESTRHAFGLDKIAIRDFKVQPTSAAFHTNTDADAREALTNVRLWDWRALQATLSQTQALRPYYDFPDVDVDRYQVNGQLRQVMIAARELDITKLPSNSRNWVTDRLIYTHGYGVVMNTASEFTDEGRPRYVLSEMPVKSAAKEIKVTRPEIYYGENSTGHVYVKTKQKEFDFPSSSGDTYTHYAGKGGVALGGFFRRTVLAWALGDISKVPFSDAITSESRVLLHRQITDRVERIAPFLVTDHDPYIVIGNNGRMYWMMDAYTSTMYYPYSTHTAVAGQWSNYLRNSVKVVVDAYDGSVDFYVFTPDDPIINAWRNVYPKLFKDPDAMPSGLRDHVRYPERLLRKQSDMLGLYHTKDVNAFFQRNDLWTPAQLTDNSGANNEIVRNLPRDGGTGPNAMPMSPAVRAQMEQMAVAQGVEPHFLLTPLPEATSRKAPKTENDAAEFILTMPFTPVGREANLSGWLAGRSDGKEYGGLVMYRIPDTRNVPAPQQIRSNINTNKTLSQQITLWNQPSSGSRVLWGNLLVIPLGEGLMYVQPIFLQSERSPIPELALVVLATQKQLVYDSTYEGALAKLLGHSIAMPGGSQATSTPPPAGANTGTGPKPQPALPGSTLPVSNERQKLIDQAARDLVDYQRLTSEGKYAEAGKRLESLKKNLLKLQKQ